jgi:hypothetical protein
MSLLSLTPELADAFAARALANVALPYPYHLQHMLSSAADARTPEELYPVFWGSYDWHSSVHMHWTLTRLLRLLPRRVWDGALRAHFGARFTKPRIAGECAYFAAPERGTFERPYGWAWLLMLDAELAELAHEQPATAPWADNVRQLADQLAQRFADYLPRLVEPVRSGVHGCTAFALALAWDAARRTRRDALVELISERARSWFMDDECYPAEYEPSGEDFLSAGMCEALLMRRVLDPDEFAAFWARFQPTERGLARWLEPVHVADAEDPRLVHWHGLNLARAFCWRGLSASLPDALASRAEGAVAAQLAASLSAATDGSYAATHWLVSFALLALC